MTYFAPSNPVDFVWDGTAYTKPVTPNVVFQFIETNTARFAGTLVIPTGVLQNKAINFTFEIPPLHGNIYLSPVFQGNAAKLSSAMAAAGYLNNLPLSKVSGVFDAGINRALFTGTLTKITGKFYPGLLSATFSGNLPKVAGKLAATPAYLTGKLPALKSDIQISPAMPNKPLALLKSSFIANPVSPHLKLTNLSGVFHPGYYTAYLKGDFKTSGLFKVNTIGFVLVEKPQVISRRYRTVMTGTIPVDFPISSINSTFRTNGTSNITIVCPDGINYGADLVAQSQVDGAKITLYSDEIYSDGTIETTSREINKLSLSYSRGARSYSITISGEIPFNFPSTPRIYTAEGIQYETLQGNGFIRIRCDLNKDILPKDRAIISDGREIEIGIVQHIITANSKWMELAEAGA